MTKILIETKTECQRTTKIKRLTKKKEFEIETKSLKETEKE